MDATAVRYALFFLAFVGFLGVFWSIYIVVFEVNLSEQIGVIASSAIITIVDFYLAVGMLFRWNTARVVAMILSPLPLIGAFLLPTLGTQSIVPLLLVLTGLSFPMLGVSVGVYFTNPTIVVFGIANLVVPIFLSNRDVANAFKNTAPQQTAQIKPEQGLRKVLGRDDRAPVGSETRNRPKSPALGKYQDRAGFEAGC